MKKNKKTKLLFLGDFLYDYDVIKKDIKDISSFIQKNNYKTILNLEAPLKSNKPIKKWINLYNSEKVFEVLKMLNVVAVNLANNHIMDWGEQGLKKTLIELKQREIKSFGAGINLKEAIRPAVVKLDNQKVGLLGFGWEEEMCVCAQKKKAGVAPLNKRIILNSIKQVKDQVDKLVINIHWGYEYERYPLPIHRKLAHKIIDCGADLIIGHHSHVIQAKENYKNKRIYYGLGNFYFGSRRKYFIKKFTDRKEKKGEETRRGLGIVLNEDLKKRNELVVYFNDRRSCFKGNFDISNYSPDIANISLEKYNENYNNFRTFSIKPNLQIDEPFRNFLKLKYFHIKKNIKKNLIATLKRLHLYSFIKKIIKNYG